MSDIRYKWNDGLNSVQISSDVSLPQFKVLGHRQKTIEASLSTGDNQETLILIITLTFSGPVSSKKKSMLGQWRGCEIISDDDHSQYSEWPSTETFSQPIHSVNGLLIKALMGSENFK